MAPVKLVKSRPLRAFDGRRARPITEAIYPTLTIQKHSELTTPMLITDIGSHPIILGKPWQNAHGVLLDMEHDRLIFKSGKCIHAGAIPFKSTAKSALITTSETSPKSAPEPSQYRILRRPQPRPSASTIKDVDDESTQIESFDYEQDLTSFMEPITPPTSVCSESDSESDHPLAKPKAELRPAMTSKKQRAKHRESQNEPVVDIAVIGVASYSMLAGRQGRR